MNGLLVFLLVILSSFSAWAGRGIVITLEAPLYLRPSWDAPIVQRVRKGENIYIHPYYFLDESEIQDFLDRDPFNNPEASQSALAANKVDPETLDVKEIDQNFYLTVDHNGQSAYVPQKYIKLIFNDDREEGQSIRPFNNDPTDYRLAEPLPQNYPLPSGKHYRGLIYIGGGPKSHDTYKYPQSFRTRQYDYNTELSATLTRQANIYNLELIHFGLLCNFQFSQNSFEFQNGTVANEFNLKFGLGPYLSYDTYRTEKHRLSFFGSILFYFINSIDIDQSNIRGDKESRSFSNTYLSSKFGIYYQLTHFLSDFDLVAGTSLQITPPQSLKSSDPLSVSSLWNSNQPDIIEYDLHAELSFFVGFQTSY